MAKSTINQVMESLEDMYQHTDKFADDIQKYEEKYGCGYMKVMSNYMLYQLKSVYDTEVKARNKEHVAAVLGLIVENAFNAGLIAAFKETGHYEEFLERCAKSTRDRIDERKSQK